MSSLKWWEHAVIYQIYPRSFQDSNSDGIGDLNGITSRLKYIADLGVDAIWISPFFMSPQYDFGYDVSNYCDVNPEYGSVSDFDQLIEAAFEAALGPSPAILNDDGDKYKGSELRSDYGYHDTSSDSEG